MQTDKEADPDVQRGFDEDYEMAGKLKGVDVLIGGHSDHGLWKPVKHPKTGTLICLTFGQGKYLGYLNLTINKEEVVMNEGKLIPVDIEFLEPDKNVNALLADARKKHPELTKIIGKTDKPAYRKYYKESSLGNLLADILKVYSKTDIAILNSGSIRADLNAGDINVEDVINIYPFIGKFNVVEIKGQALKELLEYSYGLNYGFVQQSGIKSVYNSKLPIGKRLIEVKINDKALDLTKTYTIACSAFLANGGDGFDMLKNGKIIFKSEKKMMEYFINYIEKQKQISVPQLGRQIDISKN